MKKALNVDKTTALPSDVQDCYAQVKTYRDALALLADALKSVVLPNPVEAKKAGPGLGVCHASEAHDCYEQLYAVLVTYKERFQKYEVLFPIKNNLYLEL